MFANRRATAAPNKTLPLVVEFERKPKKPHIETVQLKAVHPSKPKLIIKKECITAPSPAKPIDKPIPKFSSSNLEMHFKSKTSGKHRPQTARMFQ